MAPHNAEVEAYRTLAAHMQDLMGQIAWDSYCAQLEKIEQDHIQRMLSGDKNEFDYFKGRIEGLREAVHLPAQIVKQAKGMLTDG